MHINEHKALLDALNSFRYIKVDYLYDLEQIGRHLLIRRRLAELLGEDLKNHLLPWESIDDDLAPHFIDKSSSEKLSQAEKEYIKNNILLEMQKVWGLDDSDNACLRCDKRIIAEVIGEDLNTYRLIFEKEVSPKYFKGIE